MPIFRGSGMFQNWMPAFTVGASVVLRDRVDVFERSMGPR
jgi:hypothetical protein